MTDRRPPPTADDAPRSTGARGKPQTPRATRPAPPAPTTEHILMSAESLNPEPRAAGKIVRQRVELRNALRGTRTDITLFEEGIVEIVERRGDARRARVRLDLHYLDPVPAITMTTAKRAFLAALGCAAAAIGAAALARMDDLRELAVPAALLAGSGALVAAAIALYRTHERTDFYTIHGRARVLSLVAGFGSIKQFRAFLPRLCQAIEEAAEKITGDTAAYLRAEMREHYRLRGEGILTDEACAESTGRILAQFDIQL